MCWGNVSSRILKLVSSISVLLRREDNRYYILKHYHAKISKSVAKRTLKLPRKSHISITKELRTETERFMQEQCVVWL